jgi:serine/threonine-protein kinase
LESGLAPPGLAETYDILEKIGQGGMGSVYRARHRRLDRLAALKFIDEPLAAQGDFHERLVTEGRAMARLQHPHIVAVHDVGRDSGHSYIAMEYVEGAPLSARIPMSLSRALEVADQVAEALSYAHEHGVVHCDVKPENILIDGHGRVKVTDFGVARLLGGPSPLSGPPRMVMGTRAYMSPEARAGGTPDPRMDVYSLGIVLYEMVMGSCPTPADPPVGTLAPIVERATATDPDRRFATVAEMRRALGRLVASADRHHPAPQDRSALQLIAAGAALASVVGLGALKWGARILGFMTAQVTPADSAALDGPAGLLLAALVVTFALVRLADVRARNAAIGPAPAGYEPLYLDRAGPWGLAALLLAVAAAALGWLGPVGARLQGFEGPLGVARDVFQLAALFWTWVAVLDARRVRLAVLRNWELLQALVLAVSPTVFAIVLALREAR